MLVEIHMLQNHVPANMNRDDLGSPKTALFGGVPRARISSQCLKRSIRMSDLFKGTLGDEHIGTRTRSFPSRIQDALAGSTIDKRHHKKIVEACTKIAKSEDKNQPANDEAATEGPTTGQLIHLGPDEAELFVAALAELSDDELKAFLKEPAPKKPTAYTQKLADAYKHNAADIALFGRMTTSPAFENVEASMQVAHAISTHEVAVEVDYFTAVDDDPRGRLGAGLVKENQFVSATFYKYFSLHWEGLLQNTLGDLELSKNTVRSFIHAAAKVVPTGKQNSHAHNNMPDCVLIEVKDAAVPTSYANAFVAPARPRSDRDGDHDLMSESIRMLAQYVSETGRGYGLPAKGLWFVLREKDRASVPEAAETVDNFDALVDAAVGALSGGEAAQ